MVKVWVGKWWLELRDVVMICLWVCEFVCEVYFVLGDFESVVMMLDDVCMDVVRLLELSWSDDLEVIVLFLEYDVVWVKYYVWGMVLELVFEVVWCVVDWWVLWIELEVVDDEWSVLVEK